MARKREQVNRLDWTADGGAAGVTDDINTGINVHASDKRRRILKSRANKVSRVRDNFRAAVGGGLSGVRGTSGERWFVKTWRWRNNRRRGRHPGSANGRANVHGVRRWNHRYPRGPATTPERSQIVAVKGALVEEAARVASKPRALKRLREPRARRGASETGRESACHHRKDCDAQTHGSHCKSRPTGRQKNTP
jgi:hypothetical protein